MNLATRTIATGFLIALATTGGRADDVVVDEVGGEEVNGPGMAVAALGEFELSQNFDIQAFAVGNRGVVMMMDDGGDGRRQPAADNAAVVTQRLEPVRQRLEAKITAVDRIVGLAEKQRKKLEIAAQSDLRRLTDAVAEAREKYVGRTLNMDPRNGGFGAEAQKVFAEVQQDAARCRELIGQAAGPTSLLAKVITGTLDEPQAAKYKAVMDGRRDCRWKASVATFLGQLDETLGLTQKQHDALTAALLASPPAAEELVGAGGPAQLQPTAFLVATRLAAAVGGDAQLAAVLDPRQRAAVAAGVMQANAWQGFAGQVIAPAPFNIQLAD
jgi:hypothetical protein